MKTTIFTIEIHSSFSHIYYKNFGLLYKHNTYYSVLNSISNNIYDPEYIKRPLAKTAFKYLFLFIYKNYDTLYKI